MIIRRKFFIIVIISFLIIVAVVGGLVYFEPSEKRAGLPHPSLGPPPAVSAPVVALPQPLPTKPLTTPKSNPAKPGSAVSADGVASASSLLIPVNTPTDVTVIIQITDSRLISGSVNLQQLDTNNNVLSILGNLNDSAVNGDAVAGDKLFSIRNTFTESITSPVRLRVSWALKGVLKRSISNILVIQVANVGGEFEEFASGTLTFMYPTFGQPSQVATSSDTNGDFNVDIKIPSTIDGEYVTQFSLSFLKIDGHLSLTDWFQKNIDPSGILISSGAFVEQELSNGIHVLVFIGPLPDEYFDQGGGPVVSFYGISPDGSTIEILSKSQVSELDLYGYSESAQNSLLLAMIQSVQF